MPFLLGPYSSLTHCPSVRRPRPFRNLRPQQLYTSIQTPVKAGTHFTDPEGMEGWVDPHLLSLGFEPATNETRKESPALGPLGQRSRFSRFLYNSAKETRRRRTRFVCPKNGPVDVFIQKYQTSSLFGGSECVVR